MNEFPFFNPSLLVFDAESLRALFPFLWLCLGVIATTVGAAYQYQASGLRVLTCAALVPFVVDLMWTLRSETVVLFGGSLEINPSVRLAGLSIGLVAIFASFFLQSSDKKNHAEWATLLLSSTVALTLLPAARDLITFFVLLETAAISGYILTALDTERSKSLEAGLKYLFVGAFSSAIFLMGVALLYGVSGSLEYAQISNAIANLSKPDLLIANVGAVLLISSLAVKVGLVPFHMWAPDVYQAAPSGSAAYLASATKISVFIAMLWTLDQSGLFSLDATSRYLQVLGLLSVLVGSFMAIVQKKLRRMLAYSSVVNAGYVALAISSGFASLPSVNIYLLFYGLAVVSSFALVDVFSRKLGRNPSEDVEIAEIAKLSNLLSPLVVLLFIVSILTMAGLPPLPGFLGKYLLLLEIWKGGDVIGASVLVLGSLLGLAYYLRVLVPLYMEKDSLVELKGTPLKIQGPLTSALLATLTLAVCLVAYFVLTRQYVAEGILAR